MADEGKLDHLAGVDEEYEKPSKPDIIARHNITDIEEVLRIIA